MRLRVLLGAAVSTAVLSFAVVGSTKSADCAKAEREVASAQRALSKATRAADSKSAAYQACVEKKGQSGCKTEQRAMRTALKAKRDAKAAYRYAAERAKQVCGG